MALHFTASESAFSYFEATRAYLERCGNPFRRRRPALGAVQLHAEPSQGSALDIKQFSLLSSATKSKLRADFRVQAVGQEVMGAGDVSRTVSASPAIVSNRSYSN